jgi:glucokinase
MNRILAVDIGGTKTAIGIIDETGTILARDVSPTPRGEPGAVVTMVRRMAASLGADKGTVAALGLSLPGILDPSGEVLQRSETSSWYDVPFVRMFSDAFGLPVTADNDVNACAIAEATYGGGADLDSFFWMTISTGIGGAMYEGGRVLRGAHGMAGEIGHLVVRPGGEPCACGNKGCLEAESAGPAWKRKAIRLGGGGLRGEALDARAVAEGARAGDASCLRVVDDVADALATGIAAVMNVFDPQVVFLGGGVAEARDLLIPRIVASLPPLVFVYGQRNTKILGSALGYDAALIGAAAIALARLD